MTLNELLDAITHLFDAFLADDIKGGDLVRRFDSIMADELPEELPIDLRQALDKMQYDFAFFVSDSDVRQEESSYYGPGVLRHKIRIFRDQIANVR